GRLSLRRQRDHLVAALGQRRREMLELRREILVHEQDAHQSPPPLRDTSPAPSRKTPVAMNTGTEPSAAPKPPNASGTAICVTLFAMMRMPSASPERPAGA